MAFRSRNVKTWLLNSTHACTFDQWFEAIIDLSKKHFHDVRNSNAASAHIYISSIRHRRRTHTDAGRTWPSGAVPIILVSRCTAVMLGNVHSFNAIISGSKWKQQQQQQQKKQKPAAPRGKPDCHGCCINKAGLNNLCRYIHGLLSSFWCSSWGEVVTNLPQSDVHLNPEVTSWP